MKTFVVRHALWFIVLFAIAVRTFGFASPWGTKDHYNFGGPFMSRFVFCVTHSSWDETRWRIHTGCPQENDVTLSPLFSKLTPELQQKARSIAPTATIPTERAYYLNHPPIFPWLLSLSSLAFGEHEWSFRLVTLLFSVLNVLLIFAFAMRLTRSRPTALFAALLQAGFLGGMYFGTHVDYPNEINGTFLLLAALAAVSDRWWLAIAMAFAGASIDWPGLMIIPPLALLAFAQKRGRVATIVGLALCPVFIFTFASFLVGPAEVIEMFNQRLLHSPHGEVIRSNADKLLYPFHFAKAVIGHHTRLLGPIFFAAGLAVLLEGARRIRHARFVFDWLRANPANAALFLIGSTTVLIMLLGPSYVIVHPFWFMPPLGFWALLIAIKGRELAPNRTRDIILIVLAAAFYPYGIHRTVFAIDLAANLLLAAGVFTAIYLAAKRRPILGASTIALMLLANFAETANYRTESFADRDYCLHALEGYIEAGQPLTDGSETTLARSYYCRGIPRKNP